MKLNGIRHLLGMAVCAVITIGGLLSCDPLCWCDIYFDNSTSSKCVIYAISDSTFTSTKDSIVINSGESALFFTAEDMSSASIQWGQDVVDHYTKDFYSRGIKIEFENGSSIVFYPDSVQSQNHSLYDKNSYSYNLLNRHRVNATYVISNVE